MGRGVALLFLAALFASATAHTEPLKIVSETTPLQYGVTRLVLHSERIGRDFRVIVSLPATHPLLADQKPAVIYALDGGLGIAGPQGQFMSNRSLMAATLIVTLDYVPGQEDHRSFDLAHARWKPPEGDSPELGGGGRAFETFILEDLKPFIEAKYGADPERSVLVGHSLGALFAANIFARRPEAFAGYIMASVPVWAEPGIVRRVAAAADRASGQRIYLAVAEFDDGPHGDVMQRAYRAMASALNRHPGVVLKKQIYPGETHSSYYARLVLDSFPFVLPSVWAKTSSQTSLSTTTLARYAGAYRLPDGREIAFQPTPAGQMTAQTTGGLVVPLLQNGGDHFYSPSWDLDLRFDDRSVQVTGGGTSLRLERAR
ncbi:MAG: putative esterase [Caulobacteraceae bacterium]|nr:putative esterase [Caulobacteraceae bacterium]